MYKHTQCFATNMYQPFRTRLLKAQNPRTYLILFSLDVLSSCRQGLSWKSADLIGFSNDIHNGSHSKVAIVWPLKHIQEHICLLPLWRRHPVRRVLNLQSPLVDYAMYGMLVFAWSMPSIITAMLLSGKALDLLRWLWYFSLSFLQPYTHTYLWILQKWSTSSLTSLVLDVLLSSSSVHFV